jgi:hypothetical protein
VEEIAVLRQATLGLQADVGHVTAVLEDLLRPAGEGDPGGRLTALESALISLVAGGEALTVPCLSDLQGSEFAEAIRQIARWVHDVLVPFYLATVRSPKLPRVGHPDVLAGCWWRHPEVVVELAWLRVAWIAAYQVQDRQWSTAADFADRWLPNALGRIGVVMATCTDEHDASSIRRPGDHPASTTASKTEVEEFLRTLL